MEQNYPNPFNPTTVMRYQLPVAANVTLKVYNALGQEEATLVDGMQEAGYKTVTWDASSVASGVYYCRIIAVPPRGPEQTSSFVDTKKLALVK